MTVSLTVEWGKRAQRNGGAPDPARTLTGRSPDVARRRSLAHDLEWEIYLERNALAKADYYGEPRPDTPFLLLARSLVSTAPPWDGRRPQPRARGAQ